MLTLKYLIPLIVASSVILTGCSNVEYFNDNHPDQAVSMGLDRQDFDAAAQKAIDSLLASNVLDRPGGGRYVVAISKVVNDTTQRIDTDMLIKKIRIAMLESGKAVITTAVGGNGPEDELTYNVRELRKNDEFKQETIVQKGTLHAPDFSLSGKILQRLARTGSGKQLVEYYFQLTLTQVESGLSLWESESSIGKLGSNKTTAW